MSCKLCNINFTETMGYNRFFMSSSMSMREIPPFLQFLVDILQADSETEVLLFIAQSDLFACP